MSKYNNTFSRPPPGDPSMRFNNRPRYGANNSPRFSSQNQTSYNYQKNRNNISTSSGSYQLNNQYEQNARNYYGHSTPKAITPKHQQQKKKSSQYTSYTHLVHNSTSIMSPTKIIKSGKQKIQSTASQTATVGKPSAQNVTEPIPDNSFAYNNYFYPNYNTDVNASPSTYGLTETISPYMWHTITSVPPPNMLPQPPLPPLPPPQQITHQQQPPLPSPEILPPLQQPPSISSFTASTAKSLTTDQRDSGNVKASGPLVKMKVKRKAMSARYSVSRTWTQEDAHLALKAEEDHMTKQQKDIILILRFPDPEISRDIVKSYHSSIKSVHFQLNCTPRYCFVHLNDGTDVEKTIEAISKIPFGNGFITAEIKSMPTKVNQTKITEIDPCTLYVGNLPTTIASKVLKEHFPGAVRIDIGFAQRMKYTRYAFVRYEKVEQAVEAYKLMLNAEIGGRSLILRFRRIAASKEDDEEFLADAFNVISETTSVSQNENNNRNTNDSLQTTTQNETNVHSDTKKSTNASDSPTNLDTTTASKTQLERDQTENITKVSTDSSKTTEEADKYSNNESYQSNNITNDSNTSTETNRMTSISSDITQVSTDTSLPIFVHNFKTDPEINPEDRVIRDETIIRRCDYYKDRVKPEKELDADFEFFAPVDDVNNDDDCINNNTENLRKGTDDTDQTINSGSSLGEFLRACQRDADLEDDTTGLSATTKRRKIKIEPMESTSTSKSTNDLSNSIQKSIGTTEIKQEDLTNISMDDDTSNVNSLSIDSLSTNIRNRRQTIAENIKDVHNSKNSKRDKLPQSRSSEIERSNTSQNLTIDSEDIVPPSPLLGKGYQNLTKDFINKMNELNNYEFFDTTNKTLNVDLIKREPLDTLLNTISKRKKIVSPQKDNTTNNLDSSDSPMQNAATKISQSKPNQHQKTSLTKETTSLDFRPDDDVDLVPLTNNLLASRQSAQIKDEREECDDMFSEPFEDTNVKNTNKCLNDSTKFSESILNNNLKATEVSTNDTEDSKQHSPKVSKKATSDDSEKSSEDDDDIIVVSEYFPPKETSTEFLTERRLNIYGGELVTFEPTPAPMKAENQNLNSLFNTINDRYSHFSERYKLDKIFDELEADSDNEL